MSLSKFDYTRAGSAQARDYRQNPYPDGDFTYGEEDVRYRTRHREPKHQLRYIRDNFCRPWPREPEAVWTSSHLADSLVNLAWGLNRNELAVLRYVVKYSEYSYYYNINGVTFPSKRPYYLFPSKWEIEQENIRDQRLIGCGYLEDTPTDNAQRYADKLWRLGLVDNKNSLQKQYRANDYSGIILDIRG